MPNGESSRRTGVIRRNHRSIKRTFRFPRSRSGVACARFVAIAAVDLRAYAERWTKCGDLAVVLAAVDTSSLASHVVDYAARLARRTWPHSRPT